MLKTLASSSDTGVLVVADREFQLSLYKDNKEFFRVREIDRSRSEGSYLVVDCDIKDGGGGREVKLFKSKPVVESKEVTVHYEPRFTEVVREDGSTVIRIEEVPAGPQNPDGERVDAALRITGNFHVGSHHVVADNRLAKINGLNLGWAVFEGTGGILLLPNGRLSFV